MSNQNGDWYCRNCGYLSASRVTHAETCDTCHVPVAWHSAEEVDVLTTTHRELEQARDALTVSIAARKKLAQEVVEARQEVERLEDQLARARYAHDQMVGHAQDKIDLLEQQLAAREAELTGIKEANSQLAGAAVERPPYKADLLAELARVKGLPEKWRQAAAVCNQHETDAGFAFVQCADELDALTTPEPQAAQVGITEAGHYSYHDSAESSRHGSMMCCHCRKSVTTGEYRVRERADRYVVWHRDCCADDPHWLERNHPARTGEER